MKVAPVLGLILLLVAVVLSGVVKSDEPDEIEFVKKDYFEDDKGNLVEVNDEVDDETIPQTEAELPNRVFFHLYTRKNPTDSQKIYINDKNSLTESNWDASKSTRIVIHGWLDSHTSESCRLIRDAYIKKGNYNVILVDWSKIAKRTYGFGVRRVKTVAGYVAKMIDFLEKQGMDVSKTLVVGHSLGGHIAGLSARQAKNTVGYVVGLDPALPFFATSKAGSRIAKGDASNVQIIHTNAGKLGYKEAIGDIDFYPNGGKSQNGCTLDVTGTCAHSRAFKYFAESINSKNGFYGQLCDSWRNFKNNKCSGKSTAVMGGDRPTSVKQSGSYYLRTAAKSDFALGAI